MWKWLWNGVMDTGWKNFEALASKNLDCLKEIIGRNMDVGSNFSNAEKEVRKAVEENIILENTYTIRNRLLLQI